MSQVKRMHLSRVILQSVLALKVFMQGTLYFTFINPLRMKCANKMCICFNVVLFYVWTRQMASWDTIKMRCVAAVFSFIFAG